MGWGQVGGRLGTGIGQAGDRLETGFVDPKEYQEFSSLETLTRADSGWSNPCPL